MDNPNLIAAKRLAALGIAVFPCNQTKRPQPGVRWKEEATTDEARITSWWRRWPGSLPAYQVGRHGMLAIDLDGDFGFEDWDKVRGDHEEPPVRLRTPGGGHHIFFKQDGSFGNSRGTLPPKRKNPVTSEDEGIDIRGAAGYVVAEGAVMPDGRTYEPVDNFVGLIEALEADTVPPLPEWLAEILQPPQTEKGIPLSAGDQSAAGIPIAEQNQSAGAVTKAVILPGDRPSDFFRRVNEAALARLDAWVSTLFPGARHQPGTGAYRVSSRQLGRNLQEDLSIAPTGIVDFGVADMGDPRGGKRTPIDLVQEYGGAPDVREASRWLCEQLGIDFDALWRETHPEPDNEIRLGQINGLSAPGEGTDDTDDPEEDEGEAAPIDEALTHVDGVLGEMVDWIADCSPTGNRLLALSAALPLMGTLLGRRMATPTQGGGGLELYVISLLQSGGGKSVPMTAIARLMEVAGLDNQHIAPPEFRSGAAFGDFMCRQPLSLSIIDEVADYLSVVLADRQQGHQIELEKLLKEQWGKGFASLRTAHSKSSGSGKVFAPCYSIYGATTPEAFFRTIKSRHVTGGFANRLTVINAAGSGGDREPTGSVRNPPDSLIDGVKTMYALGASGRGNLSSFIDKNAAVDPDPVIVPWASQEAQDEFSAFERECRELVDSLGELGKIYGRTAFMAAKIATIRACGRISPVTADDMRWGIAIARQSADLFRAELAGNMLDPLSAGELLRKIAEQFRRPTKRGQELMAKYGAMTLPRRFLWRNLKHHTNRHPGEFDSALKAMEANGEVKLGKMTVPGAKDMPVVMYGSGRRQIA